jgi:molecular chaperone GrpE
MDEEKNQKQADSAKGQSQGDKPQPQEKAAESQAQPKPAQAGNTAEELKELSDRHLRLAAEFDNYKKRTAKDIENSKNIGKAEMLSKILPILDEFEIAIDAMAKKGETDRGMELIFSNFVSALKSAGLQEITAEGSSDPYKHEILMARESEEEDGKILEVVRKGYMFNGIMIRPSSVIVSKKQESKKDDK